MKTADTQAIALLTGRSPATIRSWAHRGKLTRHGTDDRGRALYDIGEAEKLATRKASFEKPVTSCNTDRTTGGMPGTGEDPTMAALSTSTYGVTPEPAMGDYLTWAVRIPAGTTINGAVVALMQDDTAAAEGLVTAELRIDGPPVP